MLLALMAQLGAGATMPRVDPVAAAGVLCHSNNGNAPTRGPNHPTECPICPLCATLDAQALALTSNAPLLTLPAIQVVLRPELPPPAAAPPVLHRAPGQPRAPPTLS